MDSYFLTAHERIVLRLAADGYTVAQIAGRLHKGPETVKSQMALIRLKLGAKNTPNAVKIAALAGLFNEPSAPLRLAA